MEHCDLKLFETMVIALCLTCRFWELLSWNFESRTCFCTLRYAVSTTPKPTISLKNFIGATVFEFFKRAVFKKGTLHNRKVMKKKMRLWARSLKKSIRAPNTALQSYYPIAATEKRQQQRYLSWVVTMPCNMALVQKQKWWTSFKNYRTNM